jgi:outer membrane receptor protein involved in Fe transport
VRLSFGRFTSYFPDGLNDFAFTADQLGMTLPHAPTVQRAIAPHFNLDLYSGIIGNTYTWSTQNQWSFAPSLTQSRGKHTFRFGGELAYAGLGSGGPARANGEFTFNRTWTQQYSDRGRDRYDGSGAADLLLGLPASGFVDWNDTYYRTFPYAAVYVQDDWKVRRNLTLNLGLRYDVQFPFVERWNRVNNGFDFNAVSPLRPC